ncbi:TasA family protein [Trujillonella endophytica]|uniref:Camelysin metallo-endopeptidase n=1 Tax=Trujillonella endophytica TaxID=673521 RepID=A0A1H8UU67_9ACTN|nr:TasA family protein [Trujillella endophytica]SEP06760.1 Camelysin metallo-endopeptidase [Trujillella endophytica]
MTTTAATTRKIVGSLGVLGAAAAVAGLGTFGTFTDSTTPVTANVASGTVDIDLTSPANAITVPATGLVPGDSASRALTLRNLGTADLSSVSLAVTAPTSSVLDTNTALGLQLSIDACTVPWTQAGTATAPTYTCTGGITRSVLPATPVKGTHTLNNLTGLTAGNTDHLVFTVTLPAGADNTFQNKTTVLNLVFTGVQRNATTR